MAARPTIFGDRFELHERAGAGGMGFVYRATDHLTGETVAVKVLHPGQPSERFLREARLLATLSHPAVVRHVADGETTTGRLYLVMEWLEGETLAELLARRPLTSDETLGLARRIASGLAAAHREGIVHRDIKPSNVSLPQGKLEGAKIIDFGVARRRFDPRFTEAGLLVGTLSYMSPEQASGERDPEPPSDVFSLGSLLYRCLTGEHPFQGGDATVILAKVLLEDPPAVTELCPELPGAWDTLLSEMLAKSPFTRPKNGDALLERLDALLVGQSAGPMSAAIEQLGSDERRLVWVVIAGGGRPDDTETRAIRLSQPPLDPALTVAGCVAGHGGRWHVLADGTGVASFTHLDGVQGDRPLEVARQIQSVLPDRPLALGLGLGVVGGRAPVGDVLDRAIGAVARAAPNEIAVDEVTARLLDGRLLRSGARGGTVLASTPPAVDTTRRLLGRVTTCVGRERELVALEGLIHESFREPVARAAIVLGDAGLGKSRLRYEVLAKVRLEHANARLLFGRADSHSVGSPFGVLREALRRSAGVLDGESVQRSREKLLKRIPLGLDEGRSAQDIAPFLGEMCGVPFDDELHDTLRVARGDPRLLGDSIREAWLAFVDGETRAGPLLIVLEDLHWGDRPSVALIDSALARFGERPLCILALGRPALLDTFPALWRERGAQEVRLRPLHRRASERLVAEVLGDVDPDVKRRIVDLSEGNAFFLEELIRAVSEGREELPETVVGVVQARLDALDAESRRLLRAASVFGSRCWQGGIATLLGVSEKDADLDARLSDLLQRELLTRRLDAAFPGETEFAFRHAVVRETAYASLTEEDRTLGHRMAGQWLADKGDVDTLALAEHFRRGDDLESAGRYYAMAAEHALEEQDLPEEAAVEE